MLLTIIRDVYRRSDASSIMDAIDDIASPSDHYGFASTGVYAFFDPTSKRILYIGLARDLAIRFAQHNALVDFDEKGCKRREVAAWFADNQELGITIIVQSPLDQVDTWRNRPSSRIVHDEEHPAFANQYPTEGLRYAQLQEGILIEVHRVHRQGKPPWNKIGGAVAGQRRATEGAIGLLDLISARSDSLLVARRSIRTLSSESIYCSLEMLLHAARINAVRRTYGRGITDEVIRHEISLIRSNPLYWDPLKEQYFEFMEECDYLRVATP